MDPRPRFREGMLSAGVTGMLAPLPRISTELGTLPSWLLYSKTGSKAKRPWAVEQVALGHHRVLAMAEPHRAPAYRG